MDILGGTIRRGSVSGLLPPSCDKGISIQV
ncbi:hypothetical protein Ccrd_026503 [Cynara cardunculus var. scolymus]|nr:hypothetical protein Ccrd_026503 [Cynara cardunculus var. scolymus]